MPTARSLRKLLERFVRDHIEYDGERMEASFTWSPELLTLAGSEPFASFQWLAPRDRHGCGFSASDLCTSRPS
jgi:hypothetical protein